MTPVDRYSLLVFYHAFDEVKAEHEALKERLHRLHRACRTADEQELEACLARTENNFVRLMEDAKAYAARAERDILPVTRPRTEPGSNAVPILDQHLEMALHYYQTYLDMKQNAESASEPRFLMERYTCMTKALGYILRYFRLEEEFVFPVSEHVMNDLTYNAM